ncbi:MAG TPA: hypothetical protein VGL37_04500 [Solirubrobacteraceae bacterium]
MSAVLAAGMLAVGIALGALIGPGPASSLANETHAAAVARVLGLLALEDGASTSSQTLLAGGTTHTAHSSESSSAGRNGTSQMSANHQTSSGGGHSETSPTSSTHSSPSSNSRSPTKKTGASAPAGSEESRPARLAPVAHVWLIELPYGESFTSILGQSAAAPYTTGELVKQGTLLSSYSALQTSELAGDATLLSGQVAAAVSTIVAPCPTAPATPGTTTPTGTSSPSAPASATSPCAVSEPAGAQALDAFLHEVVPQIEASAGYREGGLIAITFAASGDGTSSASAPSPAGSTAPAITYPAGTQVSTATATGTPGALLLSPFLARAGARLTSTFNQLTPRKSIEELLRDPSKTAHQ